MVTADRSGQPKGGAKGSHTFSKLKTPKSLWNAVYFSSVLQPLLHGEGID